MCLKNMEKLDEIADDIEGAGEEEKEMTAQRNVLLQGQISGQKLAFALSVANQERSLQRAWTKWLDTGKARNQAQLENALTEDLSEIARLKEYIANLER